MSLTGVDDSIKVEFRVNDSLSLAKKYIPLILRDFPTLEAGEPIENSWNSEWVSVLLKVVKK